MLWNGPDFQFLGVIFLKHPSSELKGAVCSFEKEIQTQKCDIYNLTKFLIIQTQKKWFDI